MFLKHLHILRCPVTKRPLKLIKKRANGDRVQEGILVEPVSGVSYPIIQYVPRFTAGDSYTASFSFEWSMHHNTQYDTAIEKSSQKRFVHETGWPYSLKGQNILEVGSGSGRFTREALKTNATVVSFDYSQSVNMNYLHNGRHPNLLIVQADVYAMPFQTEYFDKVFCFGVLQHTPDPRLAFLNMLSSLTPGGEIVSDIYKKNIYRYVLEPKYWVRPITTRIAPHILYRAVKRYIDIMWPLASLIRKIPRIGPTINWKLLIADHSRDLTRPTDEALREWAYLDTMDMLSPTYDTPQTYTEFRRWHTDAGLSNISIQTGYNGLVGRAKKTLLSQS